MSTYYLNNNSNQMKSEEVGAIYTVMYWSNVS